jgi:hypothetical protein
MLDATEVAAFTLGAELCPHPASRKACTIYVRAPLEGARPMGLCLLCKTTFESLADRWRASSITAAKVRAAIGALGYSGEDADRFIEDLEGEGHLAE